MNKLLKQRNLSHKGFDSLINFTQNIKAIMHVDMQYSDVFNEGLETPMNARGNYTHDVEAILRLFRELIPDHTVRTDLNPFQGVACVNMYAEGGDYRLRQPWKFIRAVHEGKSSPIGYNMVSQSHQHVTNYLRDHMYPY